ncbi:MAG: M48 family metallopeptidase [Kiritimatiellae bacterium]|nr:M48 family metallopeptidase [Kiritimatiellia bacterium]
MTIAGIEIEIERKKIKHTHLAVYPPDARVHISVPEDLDERDIRSYVASKLAWIREQRRAILALPRQAKREYVSGESIYALGRRYRLWVVETSSQAAKRRTQLAAKSKAPTLVEGVIAYGTRLTLHVRAGTSRRHRERLVESWQRELLGEFIKDKISNWCKKLGREVPLVEVRKMKTRWASCIQSKGKIAFNVGLARVPPHCIEYVIVHELTHFEVDNHSRAFVKLMNERIPRWVALRDELNDFIALPMKEKP